MSTPATELIAPGASAELAPVAGLRQSPWGRARQWWVGLSPARQDRYAVLAPLAAVLLFLAAIVMAFAYLRVEEIDREREAIQRDVQYTQQRLRLRLLECQEQLSRIAREVTNRELDSEEFRSRAEAMLTQYPELQLLSWIDAKKRFKVSVSDVSLPVVNRHRVGDTLPLGDTDSTFDLTRDVQQPVYLQRPSAAQSLAPLQLHIPITDRARFAGVVLAEFSVEALHHQAVPTEITAHYAISLVDSADQLLAGVALPKRGTTNPYLPWARPSNDFEMPVAPVGNGLVLRAQAYRGTLGVVGSGLFWMVCALAGMTTWMLIANWRHTRRRHQAQRALVVETNFRRAMENSMPTGMRAMDLQGRITYVNAAFCSMTGWSESELVGRTAPFPYWPDEDRELLTARLEDELRGRSTPGGSQVRVKRRDTVLFDARLYVSPLIDARGLQTGWMTSMTDITEPNRVREQLSASYERFTTVLEALDASVSVAPLASSELLFTNTLYRQWFQSDSAGHMRLTSRAGTPPTATIDDAQDSVDAFAGMPLDEVANSEAESVEVFAPELGKWLEVRTRYLSWVDGRLAQMVIATDITPRRLAQEQAAVQAERARNASRLITMGEMASSVAHELNQPLTAINNYCNGMVSRIKAGQINEAELLGALDKTAKQAQRAGQIIQRIRSFVKRSEPNRAPCDIADMVAVAVELAEIEFRRHDVHLVQWLSPHLPRLLVDPILIEQVLVNLLKNAVESIDGQGSRRRLRQVGLSVDLREIDGRTVVEFVVQDSGHGLSIEVMQRLYEAFYSTKADGMGIGLSLCRSIVESHQGRIKAENIYNESRIEGCRFSFWIPADGTAFSAAPNAKNSPFASALAMTHNPRKQE